MNEKELIEELMPSEELITEWSRQNAMLPDVVARHTLEHALTTPITIEGGVCGSCGGSGKKYFVENSPISFTDCPTCNGTGKVSKTFTIKGAIEEKLK